MICTSLFQVLNLVLSSLYGLSTLGYALWWSLLLPCFPAVGVERVFLVAVLGVLFLALVLQDWSGWLFHGAPP